MAPKAAKRIKDAKYYINASDAALEKKNWSLTKKLIMEGLRRYLNNAELWHSRAAYYLKCKDESWEKRRSETYNRRFLNTAGGHEKRSDAEAALDRLGGY